MLKNTYSCWKEEGRSKFVLQYHEKSLGENKQSKKIDPGYMKYWSIGKTKSLSLNPYIWVPLQARSWGKLRNLIGNTSQNSFIEDMNKTHKVRQKGDK